MSAAPRDIVRLAELRQAVAANPNSVSAHLKLSAALARKGLLKEAEKECRCVIELDSNNAKGWVNLGGVLLSSWDFKGSVQANQKALELVPDLMQAHYNKGLGCMYLKQPEEMLVCFKRVLELDPQNPGGHYHFAVALLATGQVVQARKSVETAQKLGYQLQPEFLKALEKEERNNHGGVFTMEFGPDMKDDSTNNH